MSYTKHLPAIAAEDARFLVERDASYGSSWKKRGGVGAYMMLCRKMDRLDNLMQQNGDYGRLKEWDIFSHITANPEGRDGSVLAEIRDLRRYCLLVEAEMVERGVVEPPPVPVQKQRVYDSAKIQGMVGGGGGGPSNYKFVDPEEFREELNKIAPARSVKDSTQILTPAVPAEDSNKHAPRLRRQQNHTELMALPKEDQLRYRWVEGEQSYVLQPGKVVGGREKVFLPEKVSNEEYNSMYYSLKSIDLTKFYAPHKDGWILVVDSDND